EGTWVTPVEETWVTPRSSLRTVARGARGASCVLAAAPSLFRKTAAPRRPLEHPAALQVAQRQAADAVPGIGEDDVVVLLLDPQPDPGPPGCGSRAPSRRPRGPPCAARPRPGGPPRATAPAAAAGWGASGGRAAGPGATRAGAACCTPAARRPGRARNGRAC